MRERGDEQIHVVPSMLHPANRGQGHTGDGEGTLATTADGAGGVRIACAGCGAWWGFVEGVAAVTDGEVIARWYCCGRGGEGWQGEDAHMRQVSGEARDDGGMQAKGVAEEARADERDMEVDEELPAEGAMAQAMEVAEEARADEGGMEVDEELVAGRATEHAAACGGMFDMGFLEEVEDYMMVDDAWT